MFQSIVLAERCKVSRNKNTSGDQRRKAVMMYPSIDSLTGKYDSKYTIAVASAKRARQLVEGAKELVDVKTKSRFQ